MAEIIVTTEYYHEDPDGRSFLDYINTHSKKMDLDSAVVYYQYPTYSDYEGRSYSPDALILCPKHGIVPIKFSSKKTLFSSLAEVEDLEQTINDFSSQLYSRLLKSKILKKSLSSIKIDVNPVIFAFGATGKPPQDSEAKIILSFDGLEKFLAKIKTTVLPKTEFSEARSVIEGAKAISRAQKRIIDNPETEIYAAALSRLESEIANFDERQRNTALSLIQGPQRIRGLAGSGKTVILAMKAAHIHLIHPEANILVTYYTKALFSTLQSLITKFYRHFKDEQPDWKKIHVRHGWGSKDRDGAYRDACIRHNLAPLSYADAHSKSGSKSAFDYACQNLIQTNKVEPFYDYILIDEGQDFPKSFYELAYLLAKGDNDKKSIIWAYDELQNILNVSMPSSSELFGLDDTGKPRIDLDLAAAAIPKFSSNDIVLSKCYRNQGEVLVTAHALGFGLYSRQIVQLLQNSAHWRDVGYVVQNPPIEIGKKIRIARPEENSPLSLRDDENERVGDIIKFEIAATIENEVAWIADSIEEFIAGGLKPEDIIIVALDDRNARNYFNLLSKALAEKEIGTNNLLADPYTEPPFMVLKKVTLTTVYRAKGNEAAVVFACGIDAINGRTRLGRNKIFAAFTRTKAWLRVSGLGKEAQLFEREISQALSNYPMLEFVMPDPAQVDTIQRDLSAKSIKAKRARDKYLKELKAIGLKESEINEIDVDNKIDTEISDE